MIAAEKDGVPRPTAVHRLSKGAGGNRWSGDPPHGRGVSARAALHFAKGELSVNERITVESIIGSTMSVKVVEQTKFGPYDAVIPEISGTASITGRNEFYFDPEDPFRAGFILR